MQWQTGHWTEEGRYLSNGREGEGREGEGKEGEGREVALQIFSSFSLLECRSDGDCGSYGVSHCGQRSRQRTETVPGLAATLDPWELLTELRHQLSLSKQQLNQLAVPPSWHA